MLFPRFTTITLSAVTLSTAACLTAQTSKTLFYVSRYDSTSLDQNAGLLGAARPFDIFAVTPGTGATAFPWLPAAGISATMGDPNNNGRIAEFAGMPHSSFGITGLFVKATDRKSKDPRKVYWTVRVPITTPPTIDVFSSTTVHTIRPGDFVRLTENGEIEFFMRQEHFVTAAGPQLANWVDGAGTLCQAANGDLFYSPPNAVSKNGSIAGGHWVNKPSMIWCNDGGIVRIPKADITYDANGNVSAVIGSSAKIVAGEVGAGPRGQSAVRSMVISSGARDALGIGTRVTFTMIGLEIDPTGGTFDSWYDTKLPNLIFTFNNPATNCCGGPWGSWHGTVFSTRQNSLGKLGSVATINGVPMGEDGATGKATGAWLGLAQGSGDKSAPVIRGLAWMETGWNSQAPYGNATLQTPGDGTTKVGTTLSFALQGPVGGFPSILAVGVGPLKGGRPSSFDFSFAWGGFRSVHVKAPILLTLSLVSNAAGRGTFSSLVPNDPKLIGFNLIWQGVTLTLGQGMLTNPVVTEFTS